MICEFCGVEHDGNYGSGRFCSSSCARKYASTLNKDEKNKKIKEAFDRKYKDYPRRNSNKFCLTCGKELNFRNKSGYCNKCYSALPLSEERKKKQSDTMKRLGYKRWHTHRDQIPRTEKAVMDFLDSVGVQYKHDYSIPLLGTHYVLDFLIEIDDIMLDIEIDGKQHNNKDRSEHDVVRDSRLAEFGYTVHRVSSPQRDSKNDFEETIFGVKKILLRYNIIKSDAELAQLAEQGTCNA